MKDSKLVRVWDVVYPVGMYLVITNLVMFALGLFMPETDENYILRHIIVTIVVIPFVWSYYRTPPDYCIGVVQTKQNRHPGVLLTAAVTGGALGVCLNDLIQLTPLVSSSETYQEVSSAFFGSTLLLEIIAICILTPILEEILYRGIAYQRLRGWLGVVPSIILSAALFGAMHLNIVQFVYAGLLGILLAWLMEKAGLAATVAAHIGANLISVLRSECSFLTWSETGTAGFWIETGVTLLLGVIGILLLIWQWKVRNNGENG